MIDFKEELNKLILLEFGNAPSDGTPAAEKQPLEIMLDAERQLVQSIGKTQTDISMQVEEIYDIVKDSSGGALQEAFRDEKKRAGRLAQAAIGLCDLIDDFYEYAAAGEDSELCGQAAIMRKNAGSLLESCAITRIGEPGQPLDPDIHAVQAAVYSPMPREYVTRVLRSGYRNMGAIMRKAAVIVSKGTEE